MSKGRSRGMTSLTFIGAASWAPVRFVLVSLASRSMWMGP
jgi:hypothetical protein